MTIIALKSFYRKFKMFFFIIVPRSLQGPDGHPRKVSVAPIGDGKYEASYVPDDCGKYKIDVTYGGEPVGNGPFSVQAYATGKVCICFFKGI